MSELLVRLKLKDDSEFAVRCLLLLYRYQTGDEVEHRDSHHENKHGYNKPDAPILTTIAELIKAGNPLSVAGWQILQQRLPKYAKQLSRLLDGEEL